MIKKATNNQIKELIKLKQKKYRDLTNTFLIEGFHLVEEALKNNLLIEVYAIEEYQDFKNCFLVSEETIKKLSTTTTPQKIIGLCKKPLYSIPAKGKILLLNNINDPGNLGTLIRTAKAFSFDAVIVEGVDLYNSKVIRSSQGALFSFNCINIKSSYDYLASHKSFISYGAVLDKTSKEYDQAEINSNFILVLGNEANGIDKNIFPLLNHKIYIPIDFESLNVAQAGAILINHFSRKIN
ncbi:MAG: TrmH family RNA methyltransferase [Metamycoplasmataceae bacterium]